MADIETQVTDHLDRLGADYETMPCDPELADTAAFCEHYGVPPEISANAILVASKRPPDRYAVCLAMATTRLDINKKVRSLLDVKKLSFASPEATVEQTGMLIGGVTPFGLPEGLRVYVDARIMAPDKVIVGGGSRSMKVSVDPEVFGRMPKVEIVKDLAVDFPDTD